jgi:hypothetical protein
MKKGTRYSPEDAETAPQPVVILLDIDGTLLGKVGSILCEYDLHRTLGIGRAISEKSSKSKSKSKSKTSTSSKGSFVGKAVRDTIVSRLRYGIIRPHVLEFCRGAQAIPGVELYVYTASDPTWAAFVVPCVEEALGIRFNRPIFTRTHCIHVRSSKNPNTLLIRKSVDRILPLIIRSLKKTGKYGDLVTHASALASVRTSRRSESTRVAKMEMDLFSDRVILVDNTPDIMAYAKDADRLVVCPTYSYQYLYDVLTHMNVDVLHTSFQQIVPVLQRNGMYPSTSMSHDHKTKRIDSFGRFAALYYRHLSLAFEASADGNDVSLAKDRFFLRLLNGLVALMRHRGKNAPFDPSGVRDLVRHITSS